MKTDTYNEQWCYEGFSPIQGTSKLRLVTEIDSAGKIFGLPIAIKVKYGKGKAHPRTGHEGPDESRGIDVLFL